QCRAGPKAGARRGFTEIHVAGLPLAAAHLTISQPQLLGLDHGVGRPWLPLGPHRSTSAPQARGVQRLSRDAEGSQGAETVREARGSPPSVFAWRGVMKGYILWAVSTSAGLPIVYRRFRP